MSRPLELRPARSSRDWTPTAALAIGAAVQLAAASFFMGGVRAEVRALSASVERVVGRLDDHLSHHLEDYR